MKFLAVIGALALLYGAYRLYARYKARKEYGGR